MRHYRMSTVGEDFSDPQGLDYSRSLIVVMKDNNDVSTQSSWCRSNKFKLIATFMILLLLVQYLFGASIYNIRIFDYNIAQIYIWNDASKSSGRFGSAGTGPAAVEQLTAKSESVLISSPNLTLSELSNVSSFTTNASKELNSTPVSATDLPTSATATSTTITATVAPANVTLPLCPLLPPVLVGPIRVWFDYPSYKELEKLYPDLQPGGHGKPKECISRHKVAIIIPYRDRDTHLRGFLHNMHSLLKKQQLDYAIYAVEQMANQTFNRAKLMNVGFAEAMKQYDWQCAIFHDVDLLPEDDRNIYSCPEQPRHMSVAIDKFGYRLPYTDIFGGISALTTEQFRTLNGFSNDYWGWGGEDDDMASRVRLHKYQISRYPAQIARYKMIKHQSDKANPVNECRYNLMYKVKQRWKSDGLSSLNYKVLDLEKRHLYTWVRVDLLEAESRQRLANEKVCANRKG